MNYKRLTNNNRNEYDPEYDFCCDCKYFGEPNGCNRPNGTCDSYDRFLETYNRLSELEDKIEAGTLIEVPCKVGDNAVALIDTLCYPNAIYNVKLKDLAYIVEDENGDVTFQHITRIFGTEAEAEKRLEEIRAQKDCRPVGGEK